MYKEYRRLELEIFEFDVEDVITTSPGEDDTGDPGEDDV